MALTDTQWGLVTTWVRDHFFNTSDPYTPLRLYGFPDDFVGDLPLTNRAWQNARALVYASRKDIAGERRLLDALSHVDTLTVLQEEAAKLRTYREQLAADQDLQISDEDHFLSTILRGGTDVFINRKDLRERLREFVADPDKTVLAVDGEPGSGRSYTFHLMSHIGQHSGFRLARVTLRGTSTAASVIRRLNNLIPDPQAGQPSLKPTPLNDALPSLEDEAYDLVSRATAADETMWLVLDECDRLDPTSDVWDCIGKIALAIFEHAAAAENRQAVPRLILLGYAATMRQLPYEIRKNESRDIARPASPDDLRLFFGQFFARTPDPLAPAAGEGSPAGPPPSERIPALVDAAATAVLGAAAVAGSSTYMRRICAATEATVQIYRSLAPGQDFAARLGAELPAALSGDPDQVPELHRAYREAACLLDEFDPTYLCLPGEQRSTGQAAIVLVDDCRPVTSGPRGESWALRQEVREEALRGLAGPAAARRILESHLGGAPDGTGPAHAALELLSGRPPVIEDLTREELADIQQAVLWLSLIPGVSGLPDPAHLQQLRERARLLEPLERLLQGSFHGRSAELDALREYVGLPAESGADGPPQPRQGFVRATSRTPEPPLLLHGMGGIGKSTLLAKFLVKSLRDFRPGFPFAYIDFERPTLSLHEPATMIAEISRQFGMQYPAHRTAFDALATECEAAAAAHRADQIQVDDLYRLSTTRATIGRLSSSGLHAASSEREKELARRIGALVAQAVGVPTDAAGPPLVIALDSFEEAQYRGSPMIGRMWAIWSALQQSYPRLRFIVSGRAPVMHPARLAELRTIELGDLDRQSAIGLLTSNGVGDPAAAELLADRVGGHPLSLKLAAQAVRTTAGTAESLAELLTSLPAARRDINRTVDQWLVQGTLYERLLHHIPNPQVRDLARAGLALRTITPELIREVLADPDGPAVGSGEEARRLFGLMAQLDLVEPAGPEAIRHRADLRAIMLGLADKSRTDLMRDVGRRAVTYYAAREGPEARAEEIYHRLRLNQSPRTVEERWLPGVERYLAGADQDLTSRAAAFLTGHLGGHVPDQVMAEAEQEDWERIAAREVDDLLSQGFTDAAAARLAERRPWTAGSELHPLLVDLLARQGRRAEARAAGESAIDKAEAAGYPDLQLELLLLTARLAEEDGDLKAADRDLAEAEDIATRLGRDFEAMGALLARSRLAAASDQDDPEVDSRLAQRLRRLPDEQLGRQPALVRAVAAEVSRNDPQALDHTLQVVGLPTGDDEVLATLAAAIGQAAKEQPQLARALLDIVENAVSGARQETPAAGAGATALTDGPAGGASAPPAAPPPPPPAPSAAYGTTAAGARPTGPPSAPLAAGAEAPPAPAEAPRTAPPAPPGAARNGTRTGTSAGAGSGGVTGILREARRLGTLDALARRLLVVQDRSGALVSGVAAAMSAGTASHSKAAAPARGAPVAAVSEGNGPRAA